MSLLGTPLLVLLGALALTLPVAVVLGWRHARGPRAARVAQRVALVVAAQLAAVALVAAAANDYGYFYSSWSDLARQLHPVAAAGSRPVALAPGGGPGTPAAAPAVSRLHATTWSRPSAYAVKGRLESVRLGGARSALSTHAFVYLPPQYFQPAYRHTRFHAAEVFTGYPGSDTALVRRLGYPGRLRAEVAAHRAAPLVLVMMRSSDAYPRDAECTDVPNGPQALTLFSEDVPADVSHAYRVSPVGWGAMGDSTGGYCAAKIVLENSYTFSAGVALSGYYRTLQDATTGDLWGGSAVLRHLNDLEWRLAHLPQPPVSLLLTSSDGEAGPNGLPDLRRFVSLARPPLRVSTIILPHGGHDFPTWEREMGPALDWLSHHLARA